MKSAVTTHEEQDQKIRSCRFFIEANSFEQHELQREYLLEAFWEEDLLGFNEQIGCINNDPEMPVRVSFMFAKIHGQRICFFDVCSRYSDSEMVRDFIKKNYPVKWDNGTRTAIANASNFHHAINACRTLANYKPAIKEPVKRLTLDEIKDKVCKQHQWADWHDMMASAKTQEIANICDIANEIYFEQR